MTAERKSLWRHAPHWRIAELLPKMIREAAKAGPGTEDILGLLVMILGLVLFLSVHTLTTQRKLRARLIASWGEGGYKIGYALVSLLGLALIVWGFAHYRAGGMWDVWTPPTALKHIAVTL